MMFSSDFDDPVGAQRASILFVPAMGGALLRIINNAPFIYLSE
jgi:hypothetical protein